MPNIVMLVPDSCLHETAHTGRLVNWVAEALTARGYSIHTLEISARCVGTDGTASLGGKSVALIQWNPRNSAQAHSESGHSPHLHVLQIFTTATGIEAINPMEETRETSLNIGSWFRPATRIRSMNNHAGCSRVLCTSRYLKRELFAKGYPRQSIRVVPPGVPLSHRAASVLEAVPGRPLHVFCEGCSPNHLPGLAEALNHLIEARGAAAPRLALPESFPKALMHALREKLAAPDTIIATSVPPASLVDGGGCSPALFLNLAEDTSSISLTQLECMASGMPAIVRRDCAAAEAVEDRVTGFLIDVDRPRQIANRIARFINEPGLITPFGIAARDLVSRSFSLERFVDAVDSELKALTR